ncbi:MAG: copper resistance protein NlpE [Oscillospiraceae bacterium]|nr:copper resistance protein NlpE [Oscillospiraceae bacterium]
MNMKEYTDYMDNISVDDELHEKIMKRVTQKPAVLAMKKPLAWKRLAPVAACLIMVVAIAAVFGNNAGWFGDKVYAVELDGGTLSFYKSDYHGAGSLDLDFGGDTAGRSLTAEENELLFSHLSVSSYGIFSASDNSLLHVESRTGNTKIILSAHDVPVTDTMIETSRSISEINGVQVSAGYFITHANSKGERSFIYIASFDLNGVQVYVECGGDEDMSDELKTEIASVIETLINSGAPANIPFVYLLGDKPQQIGCYVAKNASVFLYEDNTFALHGPAEISHAPSGTYTIENGVLTLFGADEQVYKFFVDGDTLVFESGTWLENWVEPGTLLVLTEPD